MSTTTPTPATITTDGYLTTAEVAQRLRRSTQTIRAFVHKEGLPAHRVKRRLYFRPDEVDSWLRARSGVTGSRADTYREHIKKLVDEAPRLTAEQAARIRAVLIDCATT